MPVCRRMHAHEKNMERASSEVWFSESVPLTPADGVARACCHWQGQSINLFVLLMRFEAEGRFWEQQFCNCRNTPQKDKTKKSKKHCCRAEKWQREVPVDLPVNFDDMNLSPRQQRVRSMQHGAKIAWPKTLGERHFVTKNYGDFKWELKFMVGHLRLLGFAFVDRHAHCG